jgi:hypothetical protein
MAWFHFCIANHNKVGRSTLTDMADWFKAGLRELGHAVTFSDHSVETGAINIFWERFRPGVENEIARAGIVYGIVATEIPDGHAFNWRLEPEWKARFDSFHEVASHASFIWTMIESTLPFYSQFCPTAYIELGFTERLIPRYIHDEPEHDFCFFGLRTPHREIVVEKLRKHAEVIWPDNFLSPDEIGKLIGKSKIGLSFKQSARWPIPSPTRLGRLMMAKRVVAAEFVPVSTRQGELAGICPESSDYSEYALGLLNSDWKRRAEDVFESYRTQMPMRRIMQHTLDCTVTGAGLSKSKNGTQMRRWKPSSTQAPIFGNASAKLRRIAAVLRHKAARLASTKIDMAQKMADPPVLIDTEGTYNIVYFRDRFIGVPQSLGLLDLAQYDLTKLPYVFDTRGELDAALAKAPKA